MRGAASLQLGQERVAARLVTHGVRIAEAEVHDGRPGDTVQRAVDGRHPVFASAVRPRLEVRLVELHEIRAGGLEVAQLLVDDGGVGQRQARRVGIVLVLGQRGQRERPGHGDLDPAVRLRAQEGGVAREHGLRARDGAHRPRHRRRSPNAAHRRSRSRDVEPGEGGRQPAEVALPAHLAVAHDLDAGSLHVAYDQPHRIVVGLLPELLGHAPQRRPGHPWHAAREQRRPVDEPLRLGEAADDGGGQERESGARARHGLTPPGPRRAPSSGRPEPRGSAPRPPAHLMAYGLIGVPTPRVTGNGGATSRNA